MCSYAGTLVICACSFPACMGVVALRSPQTLHAVVSWQALHAAIELGGTLDVLCAGAVLWTVANELLLQPREYTAFSLALDRLRDDPRVMVALGSPVSGYGQETRNRAARQRIPHRVYTDDRGVEHVQARSRRALR